MPVEPIEWLFSNLFLDIAVLSCGNINYLFGLCVCLNNFSLSMPLKCLEQRFSLEDPWKA